MQKAKQQVLQEIKTAVGNGFSPAVSELTNPPECAMGDIAFPCFVLAKKLQKNPNEIATEIAAKIGPKDCIARVQAQGPYVNFTLSSSFGTCVLKEIHEKKEAYGCSVTGEGKRLMVEYANLNTHKDVHIGHLRNLFLGQTLVRILQASGYEVIPVAYINDLGAHVAKSIWAIEKFHREEVVPKEKRMDFLRNVYTEATKAVAENPSYQAEVSQVFRALEERNGPSVKIWEETWQWSVDFLNEVYDELGLTLEKWYFESELIAKTKKLIEELIQKGIVVQSQGAWIVDLEKEKLGVNLLVKTDGTLLYNAKDLALAMKKEEDAHPMKSIYIVDARQSHALQQLFATLTRMKFDHELFHLSYEFVTLSDGAMASRTGNVIRYEAFRDQLIEQARGATQDRHPMWKQKRVETVARGIAFAAMRFGMLRQDVEKKIVFDYQEALSFDGFSGPYLLYTYARIRSVRKKAGRAKPVLSAEALIDPREHQLIVHLAKYPELLFELSQSYEVSQLAHYIFGLAKLFSEYYNDVHILTEDKKISAQRLGLMCAVEQVFRNGLTLMAIDLIEEM